MRLSIRLRTVLALNAFVVALALILGWVAQDAAGKMVEELYVKEMVARASAFLKGKRLPRSDAMMGYLRELFNAEWVALEGEPGDIVASSLPADRVDQFRNQASNLGAAGVVYLGKQRYRFHSANVDDARVSEAHPSRSRLYMLVPDAQFKEARRRARARVTRIILPAAAIATLLAGLLSFSITRPLRKLAGQMDRLSDTQVADEPTETGVARGGAREIRQLAASFDRLLRRLGEVSRQVARSEQLAAVGKISLSVAHELRNPLSGIKMNVRVLADRDGLADDPGLAAILREIDRMGLYLDELMSLSPGSLAQDRVLDPDLARLSELADSVLVILAGKLRHAGIEVRKAFPADEPQVAVDANQIRQVLMNLLVNAIEASPASGAISLSITPVADRLRFAVSDTGKGVETDGRDVFAAFATGKPNGVGLGLYITKRIVQRHGGEIGYDSSDGGATFWFEIPIASQPLGDAHIAAHPTGGAKT